MTIRPRSKKPSVNLLPLSEVRLLYVQTPSGPVRRTGSAYDEGKSGTALSIGAMVFVSEIGGFFIPGTSAELPPGTPVEAYLAEPPKFTWYPQTEPIQTGLR